ncbi:MAG: TonB-dependent receptor, partial [Rhodothermales bacterium]
SASAQESASIGGYVTDSTSGETLLLANVRLEGTPIGTATNNSGYYTLAGIPPGEAHLHFSYVGYRSRSIPVTLAPGERRRLDVALTPEDIQFEEITVTAEAELEEEVRRVGVLQLRTDIIRRLPAVLQPDVFRSLQLLPGVKAASDYSSGLYIRGGSPDQTLILLDRTTVYNPSHFFGFFSTFNPDAIKDVRLYKGGYPAAYGGRLGSVVDIYNRDGNRNEYEAGLTIGLLSSSAIVEGPYSRGSWMLAARRSTLEPLLYLLRTADVDGIPDAFHFVDVNAKINFDAGENDRLSLAAYTGSDELEIDFLEDAQADLVYGNRTISLNWTHLFSELLFSNFTATGSRYASNPTLELSGTQFSQENQVADVSLKGDLQYIPNERHAIEAGAWSGIFTFRLRNVFDGAETLRARTRSLYSSVYLQETYTPTPL